MTTKELLDEYARLKYLESEENEDVTEEQYQEIIKELEASIRKEVVMKLETYFGHVLNDGTGKPVRIELDQLAYEVIKIIKE